MEFLNTEKVPVDGQEIEVDVFEISDKNDAKSTPSDPFLTNKLEGLPQNLKRKAKRLQKKVDEKSKDAKSKQVPDMVSAYDVLQVVPPPYDLDYLAKLYEMSAPHNAAVTMKTVNIVGLGYEWIEKKELQFELEEVQDKSQDKYEKKLSELNKEKIELDSKISDLNDEMEFNEIMMNIWTDVESMGNGYMEIGRNRDGSIGYVGHIPAQTMRVRADKDGFIQIVSNKYAFFRNFGDEDTDNPLGEDVSRGGDPRPNEVLQFKKYSPSSTYYGVPDIISALPATLGDKFAKEYNLDYFENKAVPRYALIVKGAKLSAKAEQTLINYFKTELRGKHHGTLYIPVPAAYGQNVEVEWKQLEIGIQEASFTNYVKEARQEILMVHRIPPNKVGIFANANLAISRDADRTFKEQVCRPEQRRVEKKLNKLFTEFTESFDFKFIEADVIDADMKSRIHDRYLRTQVYVPNDVLREIGKPTRPDGNVPLPYGRSGGEPNQGGPNARSTEGAKPTRSTPPDLTNQRKERGQSMDEGRPPADNRR